MIGLSTYAFFWQHSDRVEDPLTLSRHPRSTPDSGGCTVFQICDYPPLDESIDEQLPHCGDAAGDLGIRLELGTRGIGPDHLRRYLEMAVHLDATLMRSMLNTATDRPSEAEANESLQRAVPTLCRARGHPGAGNVRTGPVEPNWSASSRRSTQTAPRCVPGPGQLCGCAGAAPRRRRSDRAVRKELHVKDFAFTRQAGWVGFNLAGCPLGEGLLDYDHIRKAVDPLSNDINQIVEHWLPWQRDAETTCAMEAQWTATHIDFLRSKS